MARRFEMLDGTVDDLPQLTSTAVAFVGSVNLRHKQVDERLAGREHKFGTLDGLRRRVGFLEQAR